MDYKRPKKNAKVSENLKRAVDDIHIKEEKLEQRSELRTGDKIQLQIKNRGFIYAKKLEV